MKTGKIPKFLKAVLLSLCICYGCSEFDSTCKSNYIGSFKINMNEVGDSSQQKFIKDKGWDKIILISGSSGTYYFNTSDPLLKTAEGSWYVTSTGIEGGCMGVIKQKNLIKGNSVNAFSISIQIKPDTFISLPFRKIK